MSLPKIPNYMGPNSDSSELPRLFLTPHPLIQCLRFEYLCKHLSGGLPSQVKVHFRLGDITFPSSVSSSAQRTLKPGVHVKTSEHGAVTGGSPPPPLQGPLPPAFLLPLPTRHLLSQDSVQMSPLQEDSLGAPGFTRWPPSPSSSIPMITLG